MKPSRFKVISFSGIDGAGKSTQIDALCRHLTERGYKFRLYTFWDDVVAFSGFRDRLSLRVFRGEKGVGSPDRPISRRDKNVTSWYLIVARLLLYLFDALRLKIVVNRCGNEEDLEFVIFDRYIYDQFANLPLKHWALRSYVEFLLRFMPRPEFAFLLDADPEEAVKRKPEYPLRFVRQNRSAYLAIARSAGMMVLPASSVEETAAVILKAVAQPRRSDADLTAVPLRDRLCPNSIRNHNA